LKPEIKTIIAVALVVAFGYVAKITQAGQGIEEFLGGIGSGIGKLLSPQITPTIVPEIGLIICAPWAGLPCTVSSRDTGVTPGGGSASAGFKPIALTAPAKFYF
jgi:hypothetical protein